ncbi:MAG: HD domain-containing phosphohydrolase [Candidatus Aminicenantales bacterium]
MKYTIPLKGKRSKEIRDVLLVTLICLIVALLNVSIRLSQTLYNSIVGLVSLRTVEYAANFIFLYLTGLLLVTYRRWRQTYRREKAFENIINGISPDALLVVDKNRTILMVNPSVQRMFGYTPEEVIHQKTELLYSDRRSSPERHHEIYNALEKEGYHIGTAMGRQKDGRPIPLEIISGEMSGQGGAVLLLRDITARAKAEEDLKESQDKYSNIVNSALIGIFQIAPDGRFLMANTSLARLLGYNSALELTSFGILIGRDHFWIPEKFGEFERLISLQGNLNNFEIRLRRKNGAPFWAAISARAIRQPDETLISYEGILEDITVHKIAEKTLKQSLERLRKATGTIIDVMVLAVEARDPYTSGHQRRVADLARAIATEIQLSNNQIDGIRIAGVVHDMGKISIPTEILTTPRKLTDAEYNLVKTHSQIGHDLIKDVEFPWPIAQMILQHHERIDGSGYPKGLKGDAILMEAKILAVADVVEAISSHRPYRPALGIEKALEEISQNRGILYDSAIVDACLRLFQEKGFKFE